MLMKRLKKETKGMIFHAILVCILLALLVVTAVFEDKQIVIPEKEMEAILPPEGKSGAAWNMESDNILWEEKAL